MEYTQRARKEFVSYEYKEIHAESRKASFMVDAYENFGWELDQNLGDMGRTHAARSAHIPSKVLIRMKRNRKIMNKMELTRLQRHFEACVAEIEALERRKTANATMYAIIVGLIGTVFMAGSVFAVTAQDPLIALSIVLAVPAFIGWILPYFIYHKTVSRQTEKMIPLIEEKYDEIDAICEKGNKLLY